MTVPGREKRRWAAAAAALLVSAIAVLVGSSSAHAQDEPDPAQELAERFAPIIMIKSQEADCDVDGEPYGPYPIDIVLDNPEVVLRQVGNGDPVVKVAPTAADLFGLNEGFYVDFPGSVLDPQCIYEQDFNKYTDGLEPTVYAHVSQQDDEPDRLFVQYWFYWYFNDWNNKHESDWEGIVLEFEASSAQAALRVGPNRVGYAQHEGGEAGRYDATKLEREGERPVVYSSAGSHASYFDSGIYLGRSASEGFGCDDTTGPSTRLDPAVVLLPAEVTSADDPLAWLEFDGRWGERQSGPFNGPTGPASKERWSEPADWFDELRPSSVVIPASDGAADGVIGAFCGVAEAGSNLLIRFTVSPLVTVIGLAIVFFIARAFVRRTDWSIVPARPLVQRRRAGQVLRGASATYRSQPATYILFGLVCIPAGLITGLLLAVVSWLPGVSPLINFVGGTRGTSIFSAALAGSLANVLAFVLMSAVVTEHIARGEDGWDAAKESARRGWGSWRALLGVYARSFAIVFVLLASIIGIPWGIRQLVRYQYASHVVVREGRAGSDALRRSSALVIGRWWHTAAVVAIAQGAVALVALTVGLLLLVAVAGLPLWAFGLLNGLVYALILPLAAIAITLLYGDAAAAERDAADAIESSDEPISERSPT